VNGTPLVLSAEMIPIEDLFGLTTNFVDLNDDGDQGAADLGLTSPGGDLAPSGPIAGAPDTGRAIETVPLSVIPDNPTLDMSVTQPWPDIPLAFPIDEARFNADANGDGSANQTARFVVQLFDPQTFGLPFDQNGNPRSVDVDNVPNTPDAGAVELQTLIPLESFNPSVASILCVNTANDELDDITAANFDFSDLSLREALALADLNANTRDTIQFDGEVFDGEVEDIIRLEEELGELTSRGNVIIDGTAKGAVDVTISGDTDGNDVDAGGLTIAQGGTGITDVEGTRSIALGFDDNSRILSIEGALGAQGETQIIGLTLTGGYIDDEDEESGNNVSGAAIRTTEALTITGSRIEGNFANHSSGDVYGSTIGRPDNLDIDVALTIDSSSIVNNVGIASVSAYGTVHTDTVSVTGSEFTGNRLIATENDSEGSAIYAPDGVEIRSSTIQSNYGRSYEDRGYGAVRTGSSIEVWDSTVSNNTAIGFYGARGGGLYSEDSVSVWNSDISQNVLRATDRPEAGFVAGGGIYSENVYVSDSRVNDNSIVGVYELYGGGINAENLVMVNSDLSGNRVVGNVLNEGDVLDELYGGGAYVIDGAVIIGSTIARNSILASGPTSGYIVGGGIWSDDLTLVNSTVASNFAGYADGRTGTDLPVYGGGIYSAYTTVISSTVTGNASANNGGGIYHSFDLLLSNSIVAGNDAPTGADVSSFGEDVFTTGVNLLGTPLVGEGELFGPAPLILDNGSSTTDVFETTLPFVDLDGNGVQTGAEPDLTGLPGGVAADNGGLTETVALVGGGDNPAVDGGSVAVIPRPLPADTPLDEPGVMLDLNGDGDMVDFADTVAEVYDPANFGLPTDQRGEGFVRVFGEAIDLGAFEVGPFVAPPDPNPDPVDPVDPVDPGAPDLGGQTDRATVSEDGPAIEIDLLANDTGAGLEVVAMGQSGTAGTVTDLGGGRALYDPAGQFNALAAGTEGADRFTYTVRDAAGVTQVVQVLITVEGENDAPAALNGIRAVPEGQISYFEVVADDPDAGEEAGLVAVTPSQIGAEVTTLFNTVIAYSAPSLGDASLAQDSLDFAVADPQGAQAFGELTVLVTPAADVQSALGTTGADTFTLADFSNPMAITAGEGADTVVVPSALSDVFLEPIEGGHRLHPLGGGAAQDLSGVETLVFDDAVLSLSFAEAAAETALLYQIVYGRLADAPGLAFWAGQALGGMGLDKIADAFTEAPEFEARFGAAATDEAYVEALYENGFGRAADEAGKAHWLGRLTEGTFDRGDMLAIFAVSDEMAEIHANLIDDGVFASV